MLATENATRLLARVALIAQATDAALHEAAALEAGATAAGPGASGGPAGRGVEWLPGITRSLRRIQLECADLHYTLRELRDALPSPEALQPRLLD
jgi:hypothetical protein